MTRPTLRAGQLGAIQTIELPSGRFQARALLADELGKTQRVKASGETEDEATVYEATIRNVIVPTCGELMLRDFTVRRCNRILAGILESRSLSAARKARSVLSQVCLTGIEYDVLVSNPVRDARRLPLPEKKTSVLTPEQLIVVQRLIHAWRLEDGRGPRPNVTVLENGMWIMVGTSQRIGEVLALRRCDVDITANPPTALADATIQYSKKGGSKRKPAPKRTSQKRRIALPSFAAAAIRSQQALRAAGIDTDEFSTHIFRRTAATIVEAAAGITIASRLLGHASEQVTRNSYVVTAEMVDPITADIMDDAFAGLF